jgi:putative inorganic carbon (hco3(-)) transporter
MPPPDTIAVQGRAPQPFGMYRWYPLLIAGGLGLLALLVRTYDAPLVLAVGVLGLILIPAFIWPDVATALTVFLLYINFPAILTKQHGLPDIVAGGFLGLLFIPIGYHLFTKGASLRGDRTLILMSVLLLVMLVSSFRAVDGAIAADHLLKYVTEGVLLYWLFINVIRTRITMMRVLWTLLAAGALLGSLGLFQEITGSYQQEFGGLAYRNYVAPAQDAAGELIVRRQTWDRAQGPVDEPNRFAQIMIVLLPIAFLAYRSGRSLSARIFAALAGLVILAGVAITLSRGAVVALLLLAVALATIRWIRPAHLGIVILLLFMSLPVVSPFFLPRVLSIVNVTHLLEDDPADRQQADGAIRGRTTSMLAALHVFRDYPILGVGPGQFRQYYLQYVDNPDIKFRDIRTTRRAHTLYFEMGAETGVFGLGLFVLIAVLLARSLWQWRERWKGRDDELADLATACCLSICTYLATAVFLHLSYQRYYWFLIAVGGAALFIFRSESRRVQERSIEAAWASSVAGGTT